VIQLQLQRITDLRLQHRATLTGSDIAVNVNPSGLGREPLPTNDPVNIECHRGYSRDVMQRAGPLPEDSYSRTNT
jgi:hypothetical protein